MIVLCSMTYIYVKMIKSLTTVYAVPSCDKL